MALKGLINSSDSAYEFSADFDFECDFTLPLRPVSLTSSDTDNPDVVPSTSFQSMIQCLIQYISEALNKELDCRHELSTAEGF